MDTTVKTIAILLIVFIAAYLLFLLLREVLRREKPAAAIGIIEDPEDGEKYMQLYIYDLNKLSTSRYVTVEIVKVNDPPKEETQKKQSVL